MEVLIKDLNANYIMDDCRIKEDVVVFDIHCQLDEVECPYCGEKSKRVHSYYIRQIQDLPIQNRQTILLVNTRKMFCDNKHCSHKTFAEKHPFVSRKGTRTERLENSIIYASAQLSSVNASKILKSGKISISKSTICTMLKKNANNCG